MNIKQKYLMQKIEEAEGLKDQAKAWVHFLEEAREDIDGLKEDFIFPRAL